MIFIMHVYSRFYDSLKLTLVQKQTKKIDEIWEKLEFKLQHCFDHYLSHAISWELQAGVRFSRDAVIF